jgi:serine phosphatase RsbU (regulator of sigma subunit)/CHASE2 domain-containing sensor protein
LKFLKLLALILILAGSFFRVFDEPEYQTYDWRFKLKPKSIISDKIVIIEIWDDALRSLGQWPLDRRYHARLIDALSFFQVKSVGLDILFVEPTTHDDVLVKAAKRMGSLYLVEAWDAPVSRGKRVESERVLAPLLGNLREAAMGVGHVNVIADSDGKRRRIPPLIHKRDENIPQLGVLMAADYLGVARSEIRHDKKGDLKLGSMTLPLDENGHFFVDYAGKWKETFRHVSYLDILSAYTRIQEGKTPLIDFGFLKGKVCFLGLTATGTHDVNPVPLEALYPQTGIHANVFNTIMNQRFITRLSPVLNLVVLLFFMGLGVFVGRFQWMWLNALLAGILISELIALSYVAFAYYFIWIDLFYPLVVVVLTYFAGIAQRALTEIQKRQVLETELSVASKIQKSFLPEGLPDSPGLEVAPFMKPAKFIGGDLYSFVKLDDDLTGIMLGDVSGKGTPAALFMAKSVSEFKFCARQKKNPSHVLAVLNENLSKNDTSLFVTLSYAVFDLKAFKVHLSSAGHLPVVKISENGERQLLNPEKGMPVALMPDVEYDELENPLKKGDIYAFYSDGVSEARNSKGEDYEIERLTKIIRESRHLPATQIQERVIGDIERFVGKRPQHDDMTLIIVKITKSNHN